MTMASTTSWKQRLAAMVAALALLVLLAAPASAQVSLEAGNDNSVGNDNNITAQCVADPLLEFPTADEGDQCADDGSTNEDNDSSTLPEIPIP
jgi:hypothetical protein